jgi:hypothetical protein
MGTRGLVLIVLKKTSRPSEDARKYPNHKSLIYILIYSRKTRFCLCGKMYTFEI